MEMIRAEGLADYRLLYLHPDPDSGERVCVGILFPRDFVYDSNFHKIKCLGSDYQASHLKLYLEELRRKYLHTRDQSELDLLISRFAPLFSVSSARKVIAPLTDQAKQVLYEKFVAGKVPSDAAQERRAAFIEELSKFVNLGRIAPLARVITEASGREILGETKVKIDPVALAIVGHQQAIVVDGIDLNLESAKLALRKTGKIAHTFWQYGNKKDSGLSVKRVALVFNGTSHIHPDLKDAHDFAMDSFKKVTELTLDASKQISHSELDDFLTQASLINKL